MVARFPYRWSHVDIIYRISRGILKHTKVVGTGLNQKPISGGMRKVVKRVRSGGNLKAISGDMGTDDRILNMFLNYDNNYIPTYLRTHTSNNSWPLVH